MSLCEQCDDLRAQLAALKTEYDAVFEDRKMWRNKWIVERERVHGADPRLPPTQEQLEAGANALQSLTSEQLKLIEDAADQMIAEAVE